jgi:hypothetical protein
MIEAILAISIGNAIGLILLLFGYLQSAALFDQMARMLTAERDAAREESAKLKAALFPQLRQQDGTPKPAASPMSKAEKVEALANNRRIPTRLRVKMLSQLVNTIQTGRDRMAAAIKQESTNDG